VHAYIACTESSLVLHSFKSNTFTYGWRRQCKIVLLTLPLLLTATSSLLLRAGGNCFTTSTYCSMHCATTFVHLFNKILHYSWQSKRINISKHIRSNKYNFTVHLDLFSLKIWFTQVISSNGIWRSLLLCWALSELNLPVVFHKCNFFHYISYANALHFGT
jgi:hypothetical protein